MAVFKIIFLALKARRSSENDNPAMIKELVGEIETMFVVVIPKINGIISQIKGIL